MKTANIYRFLSAIAVFWFVHAGMAFPLGLGGISVKGSQDGLFIAEIPLILEPGEDQVLVTAGTKSDYEMMKLSRPGFIDSLSLSINKGKRTTVLIRSSEPLLVPYFNLVVRVSAGGGTVLEKFFLALDFRKTLTLELPEQKAEEVRPEEIKKKEPLKPKSEAEEVKVTKLSGDVDTPIDAKTGTEDAVNTRTEIKYLTVEPGDTLYGIVYRLNIPKRLAYGAVVYLHKENPNAFIGGNIHRLKVGKRIYHNDLEKRAEEFSGSVKANNFYIRRTEIDDSPIPEPFTLILYPVKNAPADEIISFTTKWRDDWVSRERENQMENYSDNFRDSKGRSKGRFLHGRFGFNRINENMKIDFENLSILRTGRHATVYFTQWFRSDTYASVGLKKLTLERTPDGLKIVDEEFRPKRHATRRHPWVVYVAYTEDADEAKSIISKLRRAGFEAFEARSFLSPERGFRIFVGRAGNRTQAEKISYGLKENGKKFTKVLEFPFALEAGVFAGRGESDSARDRLLEKGFSPYLVESVKDGELKYGVYVGAYVSEAGAEAALKTITGKEYSLIISKP